MMQKGIVSTIQRMLLYAVLGMCLVIFAGCGGRSEETASTKKVLVVHDSANVAAGIAHWHYMVLNAEGDLVDLGSEHEGLEQNLVSVPSDAGFVVVQAHDERHQLLDEDIYFISQGGEGLVATMSKDHSRWMTDNPRVQESTIAEITLPGAHDAGMGEISSCSDYANDKTTQTQTASFKEMLKSGVRYFDVRPILGAPGSSGMRLGHFQWVGKELNLGVHKFTLRNEGCVGYSMDAMLNDVRAFAVGNKDSHEIVLLKMSHFMDFAKYDNKDSHFDQADFNELEAKIRTKLDGYLITGKTGFRNSKISTLTQDGPKVIVTFDASGYEGSDGIYSEKHLNLYDTYSNQNNVDKMKDDQFAKMNEYGRPMDRPVNPYRTSVDRSGKCYGQCKEWLEFEDRVKKDKLNRSYFLLSWTLTQSENQAIGCSIPLNIGKIFGYDCTPLQDLAVKANRSFAQVISQSKKSRIYPNVIYTDNADDGATNASIAINAIDRNW